MINATWHKGDSPPPAPHYPRLKRHRILSGIVVLFTDRVHGVVINSTDTSQAWSRVGYWSTAWPEENFTDLEGSIELENAQ
jgi:hypothetical protein